MLKLREWNEVLDYADQIEEELISNGYNVKLHEYSMYDGRKGIYLTLYDNHNKVHQQYASGVHDSVNIRDILIITRENLWKNVRNGVMKYDKK